MSYFGWLFYYNKYDISAITDGKTCNKVHRDFRPGDLRIRRRLVISKRNVAVGLACGSCGGTVQCIDLS